MPCPAYNVLRELRNLRLTRRAPTQGLFVTTDAAWTSLFAEMGFMTAEVWFRDLDALVWPINGLRVFAVVSWRDYEQRLALFQRLLAAEPSDFEWRAIESRTGNMLGKVNVVGGVPHGTV